MNTKLLSVALMLGLAGAASAANADSGPWYLGLSAGNSDYGSLIDNTAAAFPIGSNSGAPFHTTVNSISSSKSDIGFQADLGYDFNRYFALEGGYFNMGTGNLDVGLTSATSPGNFDIHFDFKLSGWELNAVGTLWMSDNWGLYGFGGPVAARLKQDASSTIIGVTGSSNPSASNTTYDIGVGVRYDSGSAWGFRAGYKQFHDVGDSNTTGRGNVNFLFVAAIYGF